MEITETTAPKSRWRRNLWGIFIVYLIVVVIVQIMFIWRLHGQIVRLGDELEETHASCRSFHSITKRYVHHCPPGCIRRRRRKGLFGAAGRQVSTSKPYLSSSRSSLYGNIGQQGERGSAGNPVFVSGQPGHRGLAGASGQPGQRGSPGEPGGRGGAGAPGEPGGRGAAGAPGEPGGRGAAGAPGEPGGRGAAGAPGQPGGRGGPGAQGYPGQRGGAGFPGLPGGAGAPGSPGMPGMQGARGSPGGQGLSGEAGAPGMSGSNGARGPSGERGPPGTYGYSYDYGHNYNTGTESSANVEDGSRPVVKSGHTRGDQGMPRFDPNFPLVPLPKRNETQMSDVVKELRLLDHPECKDDLDHQALLDTFKEKGRVSFMILVDLQDSVYCIVHSKTET